MATAKYQSSQGTQIWLWRLALLVAIGLTALAYWESYWVLRKWSTDVWWPLCLDAPGLVAVFLAIRRNGEDHFAIGVAVVFGIALEAFNVGAEWPDPKAMLIHSIPPLTLLAVFQLLMREIVGGAAPPPPANTTREPGTHDHSRTHSRPARGPVAKIERLLRANPDANWHDVVRATGLGEHAAKRALTAARSQLRAVEPSAPLPNGASHSPGSDAESIPSPPASG